MDESDIQDMLLEAIDAAGEEPAFSEVFVSAISFREGGVLSGNKGIVLSLRDGSEFQITIVRSR